MLSQTQSLRRYRIAVFHTASDLSPFVVSSMSRLRCCSLSTQRVCVSCSGMNRNSASDVTLHRESLAQLWSLAAVALDLKEKTLYPYSNLDSEPESGSEVDVIGAANAKEEWLAHALGGQLLRTVFSQCRRMGEVQTAATLICMMHTSEEMVDVLCTGDDDESNTACCIRGIYCL